VILALDDAEQTLSKGDSVTIPTGAPRQWRKEAEDTAQILVISVNLPA
jgi:quercetin dioxygenase-like cupin family protein